MLDGEAAENQELADADAKPVESVKTEEAVEMEETEANVEEVESKKVKDDKEESIPMDTSELDASKENSLSVSLFVHTDDIQDDLDDDLKEAAAAEAAKAAAAAAAAEDAKAVAAASKSQEMQEDKLVKGKAPTKDSESKPLKDDVKTSKETKGEDKAKEGSSTKAQSSSDKEAKGKAPDSKTTKAAEKTTKPADKTQKTSNKSTASAKDKKETGKSLWVSNLSSVTRAADLKTRFSQYGKVRYYYVPSGVSLATIQCILAATTSICSVIPFLTLCFLLLQVNELC